MATRPSPHRRFFRTQQDSEELWACLFISPWLVWFLIFTASAMAYSFGVSFWETNWTAPPMANHGERQRLRARR